MMLEIARKAMKFAQGQGAKEVEAFVVKSSVTTVRMASGRVIEVKRVREQGIGLRAAIGRKVGFAYANEPTHELVKQVVSIARARPPDPNFPGFAPPVRPKRVEDIYDKALATLPYERATSMAELMLESALGYDRRIVEASGALTVVAERCAIANTNGLAAVDRTTRILGHLTAEARDLRRSEGTAWLGATKLKAIKIEEVGERAAELAVNSLKPLKIPAGSYDIILEPPAAAELFYHMLGYAFNGQEVHDRISYLSDRLGEVIAAEELSISDWGNMPGGLCSRAVDDEGVPAQRTPLIERGRLVGFVYDLYYAAKAGSRSTGNGLRVSDLPARCHAVEPSPHVTNLFVSSGDFKREELVADTKRGLLLSRIWYTYPMVPQLGDFSTTSRCGFLVRDGEIAGAIEQVRIHENMLRLLKNISGIADDREQVMPWGASTSVCSPSVRFSDVRVR
ncbi:MAG: TldD/PmbA family protein [Hadesarchaea archaeon]|nr:TldD/PmbA family protein [Hadesarchaea archaeon]